MDYDNFDYGRLTKALEGLDRNYCEVAGAGSSVQGRELWYVKIGKGSKKVFLNGAHHALEWITASLLMGWCEDFIGAIKDDGEIGGKRARDIYEKCTYYIMPMVNPDGVELVINGLSPENDRYVSVSEMIGDGDVQTMWQANINGVDLNHNYDALFYEYARIARESGYGSPGPRRYPGPFPFSEPETRSVRELVLKEEFPFAVAFHSQGEVIYWSFNGFGFYREARGLADASGYELDTASGISSYSGFKDWYLDKFNLPAFTVEVGKGVNPLPFDEFEDIRDACYPLIAECAYLV